MASRVAFMRLGWGYAMLGPPVWMVLLQVLERSPEQVELKPLLTGAAGVAIFVSLTVPEVVRRWTGLRTRVLPPEDFVPDASEEARRTAKMKRESRAFELHLVAWVLSLLAAAIPGMAGLMLGITGQELTLPHTLIAVAFVLTALRFPSHRSVREAMEQT
jgi:hypothetical protein